VRCKEKKRKKEETQIGKKGKKREQSKADGGVPLLPSL
jgi:hypothetical protein